MGYLQKFPRITSVLRSWKLPNNTVLVEASPYDKLANIKLWNTGDNLLGKILEEVRKDLIGEVFFHKHTASSYYYKYTVI